MQSTATSSLMLPVTTISGMSSRRSSRIRRCVKGVELRKIEVREDDVGTPIQRLPILVLRRHSTPIERQAGLPQLTDHQFRVFRPIFYNQNFDHRALHDDAVTISVRPGLNINPIADQSVAAAICNYSSVPVELTQYP